MTMSSPSLPYSSIRRSARPSVRTEPQIDPATLPSQFNVSRESSSLLQLLQLLSYHEVKHRSVTLNEGFNRGAALGEGASYRVKESILPTDGFLHHLYLRNPPIGDVEVSTFEDAAEEKWTPDSRGAYKGTSDYSTLIRELRILCHQPLYEKEYIVRLGGLAWVSNPVAQGDNLPQEKPIILVESAKRGSLLQFMRSDEWRQGSEGPSLRAKLRICMRVLRCITALHQCQIVHVDIKSDNVLVYDSPGNNSENWAVKLSDFGNSLPNIATNDDHALPVRGTALYCAPELDAQRVSQSDLLLPKAIDIWSWGMLLWEVINDGKDYKDSADKRISWEDMQQLREEGLVSRIARDSVLKRLKSRHAQDIARDHGGMLTDIILQCLEDALQREPNQRISAHELLCRLQEVLRQEDVPPRSDQQPITAIQDLPLFDIAKHYYDLVALPTVPTQIFKAFQEYADSTEPTLQSYAQLQLGYCHVSGFGTAVNHSEALATIIEAAANGSKSAQLISARIHRALGIPFPTAMREDLYRWLLHASQTGSRIATQDINIEFPGTHRYTLSGCPWRSRLQRLLEDAKSGEQLSLLEADLSRGDFGDSMLHWCAFLEPRYGVEIAKKLIRAKCSTVCFTRRAIPVGGSPNTEHSESSDLYRNDMPSRTSPIDWAIIADNLELLKVLLAAPGSSMQHGITVPGPVFTALTCATHFQRLECLRYIISQGFNPDDLDDEDCTALFHAVRPNIFERILEFSATPRNVHQDQDNATPESAIKVPYLRREVEVLSLLLEHRASPIMHKRNDFGCLHLATTSENIHVLRCLLGQGHIVADIDKKAKKLWSPLGYAIALGNEPAVALLLSNGASALSVRAGNFNALHICVMYVRPQSEALAKTILDSSPTLVNRCSSAWFTPLHYAAIAGSAPMIKFLVERGAHLTAVGSDPGRDLTPLGSAIAYRSQLGVQEMFDMHKRKGVPAVAAWDHRPLFPFLALSRVVRPITMILAPGGLSIGKNWQEFRGPPLYVGSYEPLQDSDSRAILELALQNPGSGTLMELLKMWYYKMIAYYSVEHRSLGWDGEVFHVFALLFRFSFGLLWFAIFRVDTRSPAMRWAIRVRDNAAIELLLDDYRERQKFIDIRGMIRYAQLRMLEKPVLISPKNCEVITQTLMDYQRVIFETARMKRTSGILVLFWKLLYMIYLNTEQREYDRFNNWWLAELPIPKPGVMEFRSFVPPPRMSLYTILFAILWAILGQMLHSFSSFINMTGAQLAASNYVWLVFHIVILHMALLWPFLFRIISVYYNAVVGDHYGVKHSLFQIGFILVVVGYCTTGAYFIDPAKGTIIPFKGDWHTYQRPDSSGRSTIIIPPTVEWNGQLLKSAPLSALVSFFEKSMALQAYLITVSLVTAILFFFCLLNNLGSAIFRLGGESYLSMPFSSRTHRFHQK